MEEVDKSAISWLHGLQEFFKFQGDETSSNYTDFILKLLYANNPMISLTEEADILEFISMLRKFTDNNIFTVFHKYYREEHSSDVLRDAFSRGQVQSKIWLVNELEKINNHYHHVLIIAGWYGQLLHYFKNITYDFTRIVDMDRTACLISDSIFNVKQIENHKVKAVAKDINDIEIFRTGYVLDVENFKRPEDKTYRQIFLPDLIINTSAEHMNSDWYESIRYKDFKNKPLVAIQSNNLFDVEEHVNCVHSIDHMKKKYPMSEILYEGELQLKGYKRIMLIGYA